MRLSDDSLIYLPLPVERLCKYKGRVIRLGVSSEVAIDYSAIIYYSY